MKRYELYYLLVALFVSLPLVAYGAVKNNWPMTILGVLSWFGAMAYRRRERIKDMQGRR